MCHCVIQDTGEVKWKNYWNPRLYVDNCSDDLSQSLWFSVLFNSRQEAYVVERRRIKDTFSNDLELTWFPFDTQVGIITAGVSLFHVSSCSQQLPNSILLLRSSEMFHVGFVSACVGLASFIMSRKS